jgi:hypothetical protein
MGFFQQESFLGIVNRSSMPSHYFFGDSEIESPTLHEIFWRLRSSAFKIQKTLPIAQISISQQIVTNPPPAP